ncbi:hypothetical protein CNR22_12880 [Sphingobacteriaceae bacterium]|nr:hypothetical protein CNR22_12880 [Sphingobacteriaceae bacterium]
MRTTLSLFILIFFSLIAASQNETRHWYFGNKAGLDFTTSPPTLVNNSSMHVSEGCSTVSDTSGNLLFYTGGDTIWNKNHQVMANGAGLFGDGSSSQSCIIVKQPGNAGIYYVFTVQGGVGSAGVYYSVVDMSLAAGMGSVTVKNSPIAGPSEEKITAIKHCNGKDYWIVTTFNNFYQTYFQVFSSYLLSSTGVTTLAATSIATVQGGFRSAPKGSLKGSPDGKRLGLATSYASGKAFYLMDFDNTTGQVSNPLSLGYPAGYGCEFSSDGKKIYATFPWAAGMIVQWDLSIPTSSAVVASETVIGTFNYIGAMQLASDGKIYLATNQHSLLVINNPNALGAACNLTVSNLSFPPGGLQLGLPNFPADYFWNGSSLAITTNNSLTLCKGQTKTLTVAGANSYSWNIGGTSPTVAVSPTITTSYSVVGTTTAGCVYKGYATVTVNNCTGFSDFENGGMTMRLFPNPANDYLQLEFSNGDENSFKKWSIFNQLGQLVGDQNISLTDHNKIELVDLPEGVYSLVLKSDDSRTLSKRFVISR